MDTAVIKLLPYYLGHTLWVIGLYATPFGLG